MGADNRGYTGIAGGDILRAYKAGTTFILENNGIVGGVSRSGVDNDQGPGFGEFFNDDYFIGSNYCALRK